MPSELLIQQVLSESGEQEGTTLEEALREAREWRARALNTQKAAETLKTKAQTLQQKAKAAVEANRELTLSLRKARNVAQEFQARNRRLQQEVEELKQAAEQAETERNSAALQSSTTEQQLALYQTALSELRQGQDLQEIVAAIRDTLENPEAERQLKAELESCRNELSEAQEQKEALREDLWANRAVLENKIGKLQDQNIELQARMSALQDSTEKDASERAIREHEIDEQLQDVLLQLKLKSKALAEKEQELRTHEDDTQRLVEELYAESEALRTELGILSSEKLESEQNFEAQITQLEDERSDLEIVNADLFQRIAELESGS